MTSIKPREVVKSGRMTQAGVGPAQFGRDIGMPRREPFDMDFIDDGVVPVFMEQLVAGPVESRIDDHRAGHEGGAVGFAPAEVLRRVVHPVGVERRV